MVPNYSRKIIRGWINSSCTVISHNIQEIVIGDTGSKSYLTKSVKEQRVDDNWHELKTCLRCTLMDFKKK